MDKELEELLATYVEICIETKPTKNRSYGSEDINKTEKRLEAGIKIT